jgi:hypothetical protein
LGLFESPLWLRALVPGQTAWDNAVTAFENEEYGRATAHIGAMLGEQVLAIATLGQGAKVKAGVTVGINAVFKTGTTATSAGIGNSCASTLEYTITKTVSNNLATRPYINSPSTITNIMKAGRGVPDAYFKGGMNYKVPGAFNGADGIWELGINPKTNTIYHFLFKSIK